MSTYLYYTQGIREFQEENIQYFEEKAVIRLVRKKPRCPKCGRRKVTLEDSVWSRLDAGACTVSSLNGSAVSGNDLILPGLSGSFYEAQCR